MSLLVLRRNSERTWVWPVWLGSAYFGPAWAAAVGRTWMVLPVVVMPEFGSAEKMP